MGRGRTTGALFAIVSLIATALPLSLVVASATPAAAATQTFKILTIGDSITRGAHDGRTSATPNTPSCETAGYRLPLQNTLRANGYSFDFVGTQADGPSSMDRNNDGHNGFTIESLRARVFDYLASAGSGGPDVVLLMAGINDIGLASDPISDAKVNEFIGSLSTLVQRILDNSNARIVVAKLTPWKNITRLAAKQDATSRFNARIPSGLPSSNRISVVDMFSNFNRSNTTNCKPTCDPSKSWLDDDQHPNVYGYGQVASRWYPTLKNVLDNMTGTPPGAPTIGTATAGNAQATVSFTAPANPGSTPITSYKVTSTPGNKTATGTGSPLTVTGLTNGTSYTFKVQAINAAGPGASSQASNAVTPSAGTAPGAPTIGTATAGNAQATVSFTAPANPGSTPITSYKVTSTPGNKTATGTGSPLTVTGLTNSTSYTFKVQAINAAGPGASSQASNAVVPTGPPPGPETYLSDLDATSVSGTFQKDKHAGGGSMVLNGVPYSKGIGVNAISTVTYALGGQYKNFITDVGIDDSCTGTNKSNIQIVADGAIVFPPSGTHIFTPSSPTLPLNLDITGKSSLSLTASGAGDGTTCDRIDWAGARLTTTTSSAAAPGAPTIGPATAGDASATLDWTAPASDGGSPITAYIVYNGTGTTSPVWFGGPTPTNADITGLTNGSPYQFTVRATNSVGTSPASALSNSVTPQGTPATAPDAPTIGTATAGDTTASVAFTPPVDNGGAAITKYRVYANGGSTVAAEGTQSPINVPNLTNNTPYTFTVTAENSAGEGPQSSPSNQVTPIAPPAPTVPGAPTIGTATAGNTTASVAFTPPVDNGGAAITKYRVYANGGSTVAAEGTQSPINVPNLTNNTPYTFTVTAENSAGEGPQSSPSSQVTPTAPPVGTDTFIGDLTPASASHTRYWRNKGTNNPKLKILSLEYTKGVQVDAGAASPFNLTYNLPGAFSRFKSDIGIDNYACGPGGNVRFKVFVNGGTTPIYDSGATGITGGTNPTKQVDVDITSATTLTLRVEKLGASCNYADWADAKLVP